MPEAEEEDTPELPSIFCSNPPVGIWITCFTEIFTIMEALRMSELELNSPVDDAGSETSREDGFSDSSSLVYSHEPYETYKDKVVTLVQHIWPTTADADIEIERMNGGSFNRIIGVRITRLRWDDHLAQSEDYVLRVPRYDFNSISEDIVPMDFLRHCSTISVPETVAFDTTDQNVLESPYLVQRRIAGESLLMGYLQLNFKQRCDIARQLGTIYSDLSNIKSQHIGKLNYWPHASSTDSAATTTRYAIQRLRDTGVSESWLYEESSAFPDCSTALFNIFEHRVAVAQASSPPDLYREEYNGNYLSMAREMDEAGFFKDVPFSLCHLDLVPHNMLITHDDDGARISAVLDWDSAMFAPAFAACKPPSWLWAWNSEDDEDERVANDEPADPNDREIKQIFEEAAGPLYARFAYNPAYRLARSLFKLGVFGMRYNEDLTEADAMQEEWAEMRSKSVEVTACSAESTVVEVVA